MQPDSSLWSWFTSSDDVTARSLTFAKGISVDGMIAAFGMDPAAAEPMTWSDAYQRFVEGVEHDFNDPPYYVRVADLGTWSVAFEDNQALWVHPRPAEWPQLGLDVEVLVATWTITTGTIFTAHFSGGLSIYDPWTSSDSDPDFLAQLAEAWTGLADDSSDLYEPTLLAVFTQALGIAPFTIEMARGPLMTASRE
jgi:hypothetical protein